ncbi:LysM peptidoglycan-binding domain-containing protein, partial [Patescibacteria group bacterium]|nr:LysM peptidoglycan-binding domain-containing protein [Patescibacteria group bacterium]
KLLVIAISLLLLFLGNEALAVGSKGLMIDPHFLDPADAAKDKSWFIYNLDRGESKKDAIRIFNDNEEVQYVKVYAVDAVTTTQGGFAPGDPNYEQTGVGSWIEVEVDRDEVIELAPGEEKIINFTTTIPEVVDVGDHMGAVVMEMAEPEGMVDEGGTAVNIVTRVGIRVYQTVPGEVTKKLEINSITTREEDSLLFEGEVRNNWLQFKRLLGFGRPVMLDLEITNLGNVRHELLGDFTMYNLFGQISHQQSNQIGEIFPGETNNVPVRWGKPWPAFGRFRLITEVTYDQEMNPATKEIIIWVLPYNLIFILLIVVVIFALVRLVLQLIVIKKRKKWATHVVQPGETVMDIANMYGIGWKKVIKVNKLKKPFTLASGQILWIPGVRKKEAEEGMEGAELPEIAKEGKIISLGPWNLSPLQFWLGLAGLIIIVLLILWFAWLQDVVLEPATDESAETNQNQNTNQNSSVVPAEALARDQLRKDDLADIQEALARYKEAEGQYPLSEDRDRTNNPGNQLEVELLGKGHILELPVDPLDPQYYYGYLSADGSSYEITAILENTEDGEGMLVNDFYLYQLTEADSDEEL